MNISTQTKAKQNGYSLSRAHAAPEKTDDTWILCVYLTPSGGAFEEFELDYTEAVNFKKAVLAI